MPTLSVVTPHELGQEEAARRLRGESDAAMAAFGDKISELEQTWIDQTLNFRFKTFGMTVEGSVAVEPTTVTTTAELPLAAVMFKGMIAERIQGRLSKLLAS